MNLKWVASERISCINDEGYLCTTHLNYGQADSEVRVTSSISPIYRTSSETYASTAKINDTH